MYNNNNRGGFYQNQNNNNNMYRPPGQNIYQQMNNNYNQPHGPFQNYNQNLFGPQTNQGPGPRPFIQGYIGRTMISSEDLQTFSKSIKEVEWTKNVNYMQAQNIPVRHKLVGLGENNRNDVYIPRHRFNDYYFNSNFNPREILDLIQEATNNNRKIKDQTIKEKTDFFKENFPTENVDLNLDELYPKIGKKRKEIIEKDSNISGKAKHLLTKIKNLE
jgi:hypothetical protein